MSDDDQVPDAGEYTNARTPRRGVCSQMAAKTQRVAEVLSVPYFVGSNSAETSP